MTIAVQSVEDSLRRMQPVTATRAEQPGLVALHQALDHMSQQRRVPQCQLVGPRGEAVALPESVFHVLERVAEVLARGDAITIVPVGKELTTQQAADLLNISRQYLVRLLDEQKLAFSRTGKHRRLRIEDVLAFKRRRDRGREAALDELTALSEELGGYSDLK